VLRGLVKSVASNFYAFFVRSALWKVSYEHAFGPL
jgi:hypothetical protein